MRMLRRVVPLVVLLLVVGAIAMVLTTRPDLEDARDAAKERWDALAPALDNRYALLAGVTEQLQDVSRTVQPLVDDVDDALAQWRRVRESEAGLDAQVAAANDLEALGRRMLAAADASPAVQGDAEAVAAIDAFRAAPAPEPLPAYQDAVRAYDEERSGVVRGLVADLLGYDPIPALDLA